MKKNENGYIYVTRIWLILIIAIIIMAAIVIGLIIMSKANTKPKNEEENVANVIETKEPEKRDWTKLDEGIALEPLPKVELNVIADKDSTIDGRVPSFFNPIIPQGFKAIGPEQDDTIDENAQWGKGSAELNGLVIEDKDGNQFVWIPVENMNIFKGTEWEDNEPTETLDKAYIEPFEDEEEEYYKMYYKVKKYGGFYVGRYEVGDMTARSERTAVKNSDSIGIKKYLNTYNYVPFTQTLKDGRQITGAKELAINFGKSQNYRTAVTSVVYGAQWDYILRFVKSDVYNVNGSERWGNYYSAERTFTDAAGNSYVKEKEDKRLLTTGSSEETKAKNIYDIAGNLYEWTIEGSKNNVRVVRGGCYSLERVGQRASMRFTYKESEATNAIGFRISFYVK